jgi:hypothetical protein
MVGAGTVKTLLEGKPGERRNREGDPNCSELCRRTRALDRIEWVCVVRTAKVKLKLKKEEEEKREEKKEEETGRR